MAVLLSKERHDAHRLLERAVKVYRGHTDLNIREVRRSGGSGGDVAACFGLWSSAISNARSQLSDLTSATSTARCKR